jgi:hypothetical protein
MHILTEKATVNSEITRLSMAHAIFGDAIRGKDESVLMTLLKQSSM